MSLPPVPSFCHFIITRMLLPCFLGPYLKQTWSPCYEFYTIWIGICQQTCLFNTHGHDLSCCNIYNDFTIHKRLKFLMVQTCLSIIVSINNSIFFSTAHFQTIIFITAATLCLSFSKSIMQCTAAGSRYSWHC